MQIPSCVGEAGPDNSADIRYQRAGLGTVSGNGKVQREQRVNPGKSKGHPGGCSHLMNSWISTCHGIHNWSPKG